ncbi:MAG: hypothetical protein M3M98_07005, partial [Nitrospirota bacterium]|nr:hypothetical protein [Nitrospirota bacterium]
LTGLPSAVVFGLLEHPGVTQSSATDTARHIHNSLERKRIQRLPYGMWRRWPKDCNCRIFLADRGAKSKGFDILPACHERVCSKGGYVAATAGRQTGLLLVGRFSVKECHLLHRVRAQDRAVSPAR